MDAPIYTYKILGAPHVSAAKVAVYLRKWLRIDMRYALRLARELATKPVDVPDLEDFGVVPSDLPDDKPPFSIQAIPHYSEESEGNVTWASTRVRSAMADPLRTRRDYASVGRPIFLVEEEDAT